jgi:anti-anti-sigma factor
VTDFLSFRPFSVRVEHPGPGDLLAQTVIHVSGEVDVATSELLAAAVTRAMGAMEAANKGATELVVDLARVRFIDASGINVLLRSARRLHSADGTLVLRSPSRAVHRMLDILRLREVLAVEQPGDAASGGVPRPSVTRRPVTDTTVRSDSWG